MCYGTFTHVAENINLLEMLTRTNSLLHSSGIQLMGQKRRFRQYTSLWKWENGVGWCAENVI